MTKRMLADILWEAANERMWDGISTNNTRTTASCCAVYSVELGHDWGDRHDTWSRAARASKGVRFLRELGCDVGNTQFDNMETWERRQGVRYMWLLLAMHVAEDEGIEVEVKR